MKTVAPFFLLFLVFCAACTQTSLPDLPTESPTAPFVLQDTPAPLLTVEPFQATRRVNQTQNASYLLTSIAVNTQSAISKGTQDAINRFTEAAYPPTLTLFPSLSVNWVETPAFRQAVFNPTLEMD